MPFRRRMSALRPVNRTKNVIDVSGQLAGGAVSVIPVAITVEVPTSPFKPGDLMLGSHVNGMFLSIFVIGATGAPLNGSIDWYIYKLRQGQSNADFPDPGNTGVSALRNQIFHEEKGLAGSGDGTPMVFKGVVAIPKGMRRMRSGDQIVIKLKSTDATNNAEFCVKSIYSNYM